MNHSGIRAYFADLSIRSKLLIGYLAIFTLFVSAGCLVLYPFVQKAIESNIESELNNTTKTILSMVKTTADASIKNYLRAVAEKNKDIVEESYRLYQQGVLSEKSAKDRAISILLSQRIGKTGYIYCLDSNGIMKVHPVPTLFGVDFSIYDFARIMINKKEGYIEYDWRNPGESKNRQKAVSMTYFKPWDWIISASSYREEFTQLIQVGDFRDSILSIRFGKTGYSYIIDSKGNTVIHPVMTGNFYNVKDSEGHEFIKEMIEKKNGKIIYTWRNPDEKEYRKKLVIFNFIPALDWIVASSSYVDEFYEPLLNIRRIIGAILAVSLVFLFIVTFLYSSYFVKNLNRLISSFEKGSSGDFTVRMIQSSRDELGRLSGFFNKFMDKLQTYHQSLQEEILERKRSEEALQQAHDSLEWKVKERTEELSVINDNLIATSENLQQSNLELQNEIAERKRAEEQLAQNIVEIENTHKELKEAQSQVLQQEKLASIGQLAAGVAHEINNPIGFVNSNLGTLKTYMFDLLSLIDALSDNGLNTGEDTEKLKERIARMKQEIDLEFLREDIPKLIAESIDGTSRVQRIVQDLRDFSRTGCVEWQMADLHEELDRTLNILNNELKFKAVVLKEYGVLPRVECIPSQINQVFANIVINAAQAISKHGQITLRSGSTASDVWISISDNGKGISPEDMPHIFDPFFTTKPIGLGTGLGLSVSHGIIKNHGGRIEVQSKEGQGTTFTIHLPIQQHPIAPHQQDDAA